MSELEEKLSAVLGNPQMMQQIMALAQSLGNQEKKDDTPKPQPQNSVPSLDPKLLQGIAGVVSQNGVDSQQQALLHALAPYLSQQRVSKLERAMRAARMAGAASTFLNAGGLQMLSGR